MTYRAPVADIAFTLKHAAGFSAALTEGLYGDLGDDLVDAVLEEAGKFATDVIAPLNRVGDTHGATFKDGAVATAPGRKAADTAGSPPRPAGRRPTRPGPRAAGTASRPTRRGAGRACRSPSTPPASRCGIPRRWRSASGRC